MDKIVLYIVYFPIYFEKFLGCYLTGLYFIVFLKKNISSKNVRGEQKKRSWSGQSGFTSQLPTDC